MHRYVGACLAIALTHPACGDGSEATTSTGSGAGGAQGAASAGPGGASSSGPGSSSSGSGSSSSGSGSSSSGGQCVPGTTEPCYTGPAGTEGVSTCKAGKRTCGSDGVWWSCQDEVRPQVDDCGTPEDEDCDGKPATCDPSHAFSRLFEPTGNSKSMDLALGPDGHVLVAGRFSGAIDFGGGPLTTTSETSDDDGFLLALDGAGQHVWSKSFGDKAYQSGGALAVGPGGEVALAAGLEHLTKNVDFGCGPSTFKNEVALAVSDSNGSCLWTTQDVLIESGAALAYRASGALVVAGTYSNPHDEVILRELGGDGTLLSNRKFGGPGDQRLLDVTVAENGDVVAAGAYEQTVDFGGGPLPSAAQANLFVTRFDAEGGHVFSAGMPTSGTLHDAKVGVDGAGRVVVAGTLDGTLEVGGATLASAGKRDAFVISLDASGAPLWAKAFGDGEEQSIHDVAVDAQGRIALVGALAGTLDFGGGPLIAGGGTSVLVGLLDAGGNHLWSRSFGGVGGHQKGLAVALTGAGEIVLTGEASTGPIDFGGGALPHVRPSVFVAKLAP